MSGSLPPGWFYPGDVRFYRYIFQELIPVEGRAVEVGVYRGRSLLSVADIIRERQIKMLCVDLFEPYYGDNDPDRMKAFVENCDEYGLLAGISISKGHSIQCARLVESASIDFVFIDADHSYQAVAADIAAWKPKIKPGGYLGGHDYDEYGVWRAVSEAGFFNLQVRPPSTIWLSRVLAPQMAERGVHIEAQH